MGALLIAKHGFVMAVFFDSFLDSQGSSLI